MTIIIEREALLRVLSREPSGSSSTIACSDACIASEAEYVLVDIPKPLSSVEKSQVGPISDDQSTCSISTDSLSSGSCHSFERRVTFAETLVSGEWTRPRTPREEVSSLFYSTEETHRFRQEYRLERKVLGELSLDTDTHGLDHDDVSKLVKASSKQPGRHSISRVVVMHNDRLETFCAPKEEPLSGDFFDNDSFWSGSLTWY